MRRGRGRAFLAGALGGLTTSAATTAFARLGARNGGSSLPAQPAVATDALDPIAATYALAIERTRQAAKWAVAAFGAVASALIVSVQLTDLRKLSGSAHDYALAGAAVAFAGVVIAIGAALWVQRPDQVSLPRLAAQTSRSSFAKAIEQDPSPLRDPKFAALSTLLSEWTEKRHAYVAEQDDDRRTSLYNDLTDLGKLVHEIELRGQYHRFWNRFKLATAAMFLGAIVTGVGLLTFAAQSESSGAPTAQTAPTPIMIELSREGRDRLGTALGSKCVSEPIRAIALSNDSTAVDVVTIGTPECASMRFSLTGSLGTPIPTTRTQLP